MGAAGNVARDFLKVEAGVGLEPSAVAINEAKQGDGRFADLGGAGGDFVKNLFWRRIQNVVLPQQRQPGVFVERGRRFHVGLLRRLYHR